MKKQDLFNYAELVGVFLVLHSSGFFKYIVFTFWIMLYLLRYNGKIKLELFMVMIPPIICVAIGLVLSVFHDISFITIKECIFHLLPPIGAIIIWNRKGSITKNYVDLMFFGSLTIFIITSIGKFTTEDWLESQYAFVMGIYVLYYYYNKNVKMAVVAAIALILAHKRIAWGGVIIAIILFSILYRKKKVSTYDIKNITRKITVSSVLIMGLLFLWIYACKTDTITSLLREYNINSMGRAEQWSKLSWLYELSVFYIGYGLGYVTNIIEQWGISTYLVFHNDVLLMYIQLGCLGFVLYFYSYFGSIKYYVKKNYVEMKSAIFLLSLVLFTFVCYLTDNISIYINYLFPYYIVILSMLNCNNEHKEEKI